MVHTASDGLKAAGRLRTLRTWRWWCVLAWTLGLASTAAHAHPPTVFACEPEWAALVHVLLPQAKVHVATHAGQDPHHIEARPALIARMRQADLAVCTGASLESGWLPMLQQRAANRKVRDGQDGMFYAADHVDLIDPRPATLNPFAGDVHPEGNPHLHTDPERIARVAQALAEHMARLWPSRATDIVARHRDWSARWDDHLIRWREQAKALRGQRVAAQHGTFGYLWQWLGIELVADLEPRPGMPPTPSHLNQLRQSLRKHPPDAVVLASYQDERPARWLAQQLQGRLQVVVLPATVMEPSQPDALERWFDRVLTDLRSALRP
jgi:zinc/manganese transport system substrate-binding protein